MQMLSRLHPLSHAPPAPQTYGAQLNARGVTHVPAPSQTEIGV